jgi:cytochrome b561
MAILILGLLAMGYFMKDAPTEIKGTLYMIHKTVGTFLLLFWVARLGIRLSTTNPKPNGSLIMRMAAHLTEILLYALSGIMALSGFLMSMYSGYGIQLFGVLPIPMFVEKTPELAKFFHTYHTMIPPYFIALISLHIVAAFFHHFVLKDDTLRRMLPTRKKS